MSASVGMTNGNGHGHGHAGDTRLRIVLVGRTNLDATLRRDERFELVRARTALSAVGEVAAPLDGAPARCAVVIAGDAEPAHDAPRLIAALRAADPAVRVLRVQGDGPQTPPSPAYDGVISESASPDAVWQAAARPAPTPIPPPIPAPAAHAAPAFTPGTPTLAPALGALPTSPAPAQAQPQAPAASRPPVIGEEPGDAAIVQALLSGRDVLAAALAVLRHRSGDPSLVYHAGPAALSAGGASAVRHRGHTFGALISGATPEPARSKHAAWLAGWLALAAQHEQLRSAALTDELTGAWNRRYFDRFMDNALREAATTRVPLTLLVFDIDNFKQFNDQHGHAAGDDILRHTVELLRSVIRTHDKVCRIGGDEFAVIFYSPDGPRDPSSKPPAEVRSIVQRFQQQVLASRFPKLGQDAPGRLSVSGGLATFPWDGRTAPELLAHADQLALRCKRQGKGQLLLGPGLDPRPADAPDPS